MMKSRMRKVRKTKTLSRSKVERHKGNITMMLIKKARSVDENQKKKRLHKMQLIKQCTHKVRDQKMKKKMKMLHFVTDLLRVDWAKSAAIWDAACQFPGGVPISNGEITACKKVSNCCSLAIGEIAWVAESRQSLYFQEKGIHLKGNKVVNLIKLMAFMCNIGNLFKHWWFLWPLKRHLALREPYRLKEIQFAPRWIIKLVLQRLAKCLCGCLNWQKIR